MGGGRPGACGAGSVVARMGLGDNSFMPFSVDTLRTHIDYTAWASRHLVDVAAKLSAEDLNRDFQTADRSVLDTLVHIYAADRVWMARIEGRTIPFVTDADRSL